MDGELAKDGTDNVDVEDVVLGALLRESFYRLWIRISKSIVKQWRWGRGRHVP
jgi:hypothetical protein